MTWYRRITAVRYQSPFYKSLLNARAQFAAAAQKVYDQWDQSHPDGDPELGFGGICQDIAAAISDVVSSLGFNAGTMSAQCGEQHVWCIAYNEYQDEAEGVQYEAYHIDISPYVYETGGGYTWKKIPEVVFDANHISISPMPSTDVAAYLEYGE
jgi:hypothetical protein